MKIHIFVEGGGNQNATLRACRQSFSKLLDKLNTRSHARFIACGTRSEAYKDFCKYLNDPDDDQTMAILLVDSEDPVNPEHGSWQHLLGREGDQWEKPGRVTDEQCHLMVQCMESWFMAQPEILEEFYGPRFQHSALPANQNIEAISKADTCAKLEQATRNCQKGKYHKTRHGFAILERLEPNKIGKRSPAAKRLFDFLQNHLN